MAWTSMTYQPTRHEDYIRRDADFVFGLPPDVGTCGAMPFRSSDASSGVNAKRCLRGEDWEWLSSFAIHRWLAPAFGLFDPTLTDMDGVPDGIERMDLPYPDKQLGFDNLAKMYAFLSAELPYWFMAYRLYDTELTACRYDGPAELAPAPTPAQVAPVTRSGVSIPGGSMVSRRPDPDRDRALCMSDVANLFTDCRDALGARTLAEASGNARIYELTNYADGRSVSTYWSSFFPEVGSGFAFPAETGVSFGVELYGIFRCDLADNETTLQTRWCVLKTATTGTFSTSQGARTRARLTSFGQPEKQDVVDRCCALLGWHPTSTWPRPTEAGNGWFRVQCWRWFAVVTPWYLQPTWR